ncbi:hypothetical protein [Chitinophaga caseinilytica]|uniref:hypothetical protein n=1 Tax=Chitinophaga caseinilytica TaxID=2267521 RepID=UPI003C2BFDB5
MRTFTLYTLKIWLIAALSPSLYVCWYYGAFTIALEQQDKFLFNTFTYMGPAAVFAGFCMKQLYAAHIGEYQRKAMIWLCNVMGLVPVTVLAGNSEPGMVTIFLLYLSSTVAILAVKAPSARQTPLQLPLHGRHITLRPDHEINPWRGMVVSGIHTLPIRLKLDRNAPYPQLECHSLEKEDIFHLIADFVPVRVSACLPGKSEPLFSAILEIDHSLN